MPFFLIVYSSKIGIYDCLLISMILVGHVRTIVQVPHETATGREEYINE
jgi:hypothetical protein